MEFADLPWHPMLVHFPIALFMSALGLELLSLVFKKESLHQAAVVVYVLGVVSMPLTAWAGLHEADELHLKHPVLDLHKRFALSTLWISLASVPLLWFVHERSKQFFQWIFLGVLIVVAAGVSAAGYNGGRMVYEYGVGVDK
jgi:uncharacterized membrane protein